MQQQTLAAAVAAATQLSTGKWMDECGLNMNNNNNKNYGKTKWMYQKLDEVALIWNEFKIENKKLRTFYRNRNNNKKKKT